MPRKHLQYTPLDVLLRVICAITYSIIMAQFKQNGNAIRLNPVRYYKENKSQELFSSTAFLYRRPTPKQRMWEFPLELYDEKHLRRQQTQQTGPEFHKNRGNSSQNNCQT